MKKLPAVLSQISLQIRILFYCWLKNCRCYYLSKIDVKMNDDHVYLLMLVFSIVFGILTRNIGTQVIRKWTSSLCGLSIVFAVSGLHAFHPITSFILHTSLIKFAPRWQVKKIYSRLSRSNTARGSCDSRSYSGIRLVVVRLFCSLTIPPLINERTLVDEVNIWNTPNANWI